MKKNSYLYNIKHFHFLFDLECIISHRFIGLNKQNIQTKQNKLLH